MPPPYGYAPNSLDTFASAGVTPAWIADIRRMIGLPEVADTATDPVTPLQSPIVAPATARSRDPRAGMQRDVPIPPTGASASGQQQTRRRPGGRPELPIDAMGAVPKAPIDLAGGGIPQGAYDQFKLGQALPRAQPSPTTGAPPVRPPGASFLPQGAYDQFKLGQPEPPIPDMGPAGPSQRLPAEMFDPYGGVTPGALRGGARPPTTPASMQVPPSSGAGGGPGIPDIAALFGGAQPQPSAPPMVPRQHMGGGPKTQSGGYVDPASQMVPAGSPEASGKGGNLLASLFGGGDAGGGMANNEIIQAALPIAAAYFGGPAGAAAAQGATGAGAAAPALAGGAGAAAPALAGGGAAAAPAGFGVQNAAATPLAGAQVPPAARAGAAPAATGGGAGGSFITPEVARMLLDFGTGTLAASNNPSMRAIGTGGQGALRGYDAAQGRKAAAAAAGREEARAERKAAREERRVASEIKKANAQMEKWGKDGALDDEKMWDLAVTMSKVAVTDPTTFQTTVQVDPQRLQSAISEIRAYRDRAKGKGGGSDQQPVRISGDEDFRKLPSGALFYGPNDNPNGPARRKP